MTPHPPDSSSNPGLRTLLLGMACAVALCGCETLGGSAGKGRAELRAANSAFLARMEELQPLSSADAAAQSKLLADRRTAYEKSPGPATALHYGLLLALPALPGHDARAARPLLAQAVESHDGLAPSERTLARAALTELDARLSLEEDNRRLADEIVTLREGAAVARTGATRRLQAELDENARLRRALEEARGKLQKLAALEKAAALGKPAPEDRRP